MIDCPCGYGKNLSEEYRRCPICGTDLTPLHRLKAIPKYYYEKGQGLMEQGKYDEAMEYLITAIRLEPEFVNAYISLGEIYIKKNLFEKARELYKNLLEIAPDNEEVKLAVNELEAKVKLENKRRSRKKIIYLGLPLATLVLIIVSFAIILLLYENPEKEAYLDLGKEIEKEVNNVPELANLNIKVIQNDQGIEISGTVPSNLHKILLTEIANKVGKGIKVDTQGIKVVSVSDTFYYEVKKGESLTLIAYRFYGNGHMWEIIHEANKDRIANPHKIFPGQKLLVPIKKEIIKQEEENF